jgi:hypothetical protein
MAYEIAYLMKLYWIPPCLVVNTSQNGIHLVLTVGERTWENKGSKHTQVLGVEDKRQITLVVSSTTNGNLLPGQILFIGTTHRCLPPSRKLKCINSGPDLKFNENHWSTLEIMKDFVHKLLLAYLHKQIQQLDLQANQKPVWLIDYWSIHKRKEFLDWIKKKHPNILVVFVPTNCTSELQLVDVIIQRPLKHGFKVNFNKWTTCVIKQQIYNGKEPFIDLKMNNLKPQICGWLHSTWTQVQGMDGMIVKGWEKTGITKNFT